MGNKTYEYTTIFDCVYKNDGMIGLHVQIESKVILNHPGKHSFHVFLANEIPLFFSQSHDEPTNTIQYDTILEL